MNYRDPRNDEWKEEVEGKKSGKGGIINGEAPSNSLN